ncbi:hypothetical protein [Planotetraspora kaengkrachanensis]|uniref:Uncharacterized protein n=1 Tax=Planotetraspora kaengkrachanensis TaxID=575193 RepID=A0A8J3PV59_9ACTN|nr:hypothetical protein [Planotetraspora kaengkrachanensis]GIG81649.1 hypothetical protein Pka01_47760 [Planotetraspora kaengkrachanensis]
MIGFPRRRATAGRGGYARLIPKNAIDLARWRTTWPSAGRTLAVASAMPALAISGWLVAGLPLLLLGWFRPLPMVLAGGGLALVFCWYGLRRLPEVVESSAWPTVAVLGIAAASGIFNGLLHGEQLIVRRDPATYAQYAVWLAGHGSLPIPLGDFGGSDPALRFVSMGFYEWDGGIVPQFMAGPPMIHAIGYWLGGVSGLVLVPPVLGALAVLTVGGTAARLVGARWAPLAALAFAVSMPVLYTSRTTFSEIPSLILVFGAMSLLLDARFRLRAGLLGLGFLGPATPAETARRAQPGGARLMAGLAGLAFGLTVLVRVDGLRDVLPVLAYAGLLIALARLSRARDAMKERAPEGRLGPPLLLGLVAGAALGFAACLTIARPYLGYLSGSLKPLLAICAAVLVLTAVAAAVAPWIAGRVGTLSGGRLARRLPDVAAGLVVLVVAGLAVRPWLQTVRRVAVTPEDQLTANFIGKTQQVNHLPIDQTRLYYEDSLWWVIWYVGVPVVVLATLAAAVLARRMAKGKEFGWLLPLAIIGWTTVTTLWRPAITPDHPWASRRLVPIVIPGMILLAVWGLRWIRRRAHRWGYGSRLLIATGAALLVVPAAITSIGTAFTPVDRGEAAAVKGLCAAIPRNASVLIVERATGDRITQLVRGECGVPTARVAYPKGSDVPLHSDIERLVEKVRGTGRLPVLLAAEPGQLWPYGPPTQVLKLRSRQDERSLVDPPDGTWSLTIDVWMTMPA